MKNKLVAFAIALVVAVTANAQTKTVKAGESKVTWKGYKVTGSHEGTVNLKSGELEFKDDKLVGGSFVVDMTSIGATDLEGEYKGKLDGHLKSEDFFGVDKYPTAKLQITKAVAKGKNSYTVTANLTIKKATHTVTFDMSVYGSKATATLKVDRTKYDIRYGSGSFFDNLGDKTIYDEFDLVVDLQF